jgi:hypothetical protein
MGLFGPTDITGVDVGAGSIKVVQVRRGRRPRLLSAAIVETPLEPGRGYGTAGDLRFLLSDKNAGKRRVMTLLPSKHLTVRSFLLPTMPEKELREAVRWESKRHISCALDTAQWSTSSWANGAKARQTKLEVLMVGRWNTVTGTSRRSASESRRRRQTPIPWRSEHSGSVKPDSGNTMIVDIGAARRRSTSSRGAGLRFSRCVETGVRHDQRHGRGLKVSLDEAEAAKVASTFLFRPRRTPLRPRSGGGSTSCCSRSGAPLNTTRPRFANRDWTGRS